MRRRDFLKSVGVVGLLGFSNISFAKKELKWISFKDKMPKVGQRIIVLRSFQDSKYTIEGDYVIIGNVHHYSDRCKTGMAVTLSEEDFKNTLKTNNKVFNKVMKKFYADYAFAKDQEQCNIHFHFEGSKEMKCYWIPYGKNVPKFPENKI